MSSINPQFLTVARQAAAQAASVIRHHYQQRDWTLTIKDDQSPVTQADIAAEQCIYDCIHQAFPDHGFYGEETGRYQEQQDYLWLVDPIDGTRSFVDGYPFFSTQIALMHQGELIVGVSSAPLFNECAWAVKGQGAFLDGHPITISQRTDLAQCSVSTGNIRSITQQPNQWQALGNLLHGFARTRGYGDFYHYHLLASGKIELVIESDVNILDIAALTVIVREAGGVITDLNNHAIGLETKSILAGPRAMHQLAYDTLHGSC